MMIAECGEISCVKGAWDETNCDEKCARGD